MDFRKLLRSPVRIQVIQYLAARGEATTKQLAAAMPDIPAPTLYRHVGVLLKEGFLLVREEHRVRGSLERVLAVDAEKLDAMSKENITSVAYAFLMGLYTDFQEYGKRTDADPARDMLMLRTCSLKLTDAQYGELLTALGEVLGTYVQAENRLEGRTRSLSLISSPAREECAE